MENIRIDQLEQKFWNGQTTPEEEIEIKSWLSSHDKTKSKAALHDYFQSLDLAREKTLEQSFDDEMIKLIAPKKKTFSIRPLLRVAAAILIVFVAYFALRPTTQPDQMADHSEFVDTFEDSERAYLEVKKALMMVSTNMNSGLKHTQMLGKFDEAKTQMRNN